MSRWVKWMLLFAVISVTTANSLLETLKRIHPRIYFLHVKSDIRYRFATTQITSKVANADSVSHEAVFDVILPNEAFMTNFSLTVNGVTYVGNIEEKEAAKRQYQEAKSRGQTAAHVSAKPRETNRFTIQVNVEAMGKVVFELKYQELLMRKFGVYSHVTNIDPGIPVEDFKIDVSIEESRDISILRVPPLISNMLTGNMLATNEDAVIVRPNSRTALIQYYPSLEQQMRDNNIGGLSGKFVVQYDVNRTSDAGDLLVMNGYFVHFFAPDDLPIKPKDVLFILDKSGSMGWEGKMGQLKAAMKRILKEIDEADRFNILTFSSTVSQWAPNRLVSASTENIRAASNFIQAIGASGGTNINDALSRGLKLLNNREDTSRAPVLLFLTDGLPTMGTTNKRSILTNVARLNEIEIPIFSLAFGNDADYKFARQLAADNDGLARKIYVDSDAALQIAGFYREISTVLIQDVRFTYLNTSIDETTVTDIQHKTFFRGSELYVAGKLADNATSLGDVVVTGYATDGLIKLILPNRDNKEMVPATNLTKVMDFSLITERLWAYLTIKELLKKKDASDNNQEIDDLKKRILDMSFKYKFVTPLTSMVVILPEELQRPPVQIDGAQDQTDFDPLPRVQNSFQARTAPILPANVNQPIHAVSSLRTHAYVAPNFAGLNAGFLGPMAITPRRRLQFGRRNRRPKKMRSRQFLLQQTVTATTSTIQHTTTLAVPSTTASTTSTARQTTTQAIPTTTNSTQHPITHQVLIQTKPKISGPVNTTAVVGDNVELECRVLKGDPVQVHWMKHFSGNSSFIDRNGSFIQESLNRTSKSNVLHLLNVTKENEGWYTCLVSNAMGRVFGSAWLNVSDAPATVQDTTPQHVHITTQPMMLRETPADFLLMIKGLQNPLCMNLPGLRDGIWYKAYEEKDQELLILFKMWRNASSIHQNSQVYLNEVRIIDRTSNMNVTITPDYVHMNETTQPILVESGYVYTPTGSLYPITIRILQNQDTSSNGVKSLQMVLTVKSSQKHPPIIRDIDGIFADFISSVGRLKQRKIIANRRRIKGIIKVKQRRRHGIQKRRLKTFLQMSSLSGTRECWYIKRLPNTGYLSVSNSDRYRV